MIDGHEYWREQSEIYALGALDAQELRDFTAHFESGCVLCAAHLRETRETLNLLPHSLRTIAPPAKAKDQVFQLLVDERIVSIPPAQPKRATLRQRMTGAVAAGIVGLLLGAGYFYLHYEPRHQIYTAVVKLLRDPNTRDYALHGLGPTPAAQGRFLWNESGEGHIFVSNLPAAPQGKMYAVWTIAQNSPPRYVGSVETDAGGQGGLHINASRGDKPIEIFAVTLEPAGTSAAPTGPMVLVSKQS